MWCKLIRRTVYILNFQWRAHVEEYVCHELLIEWGTSLIEITHREPLRYGNGSFHVDLGFTTAAVHLLYIRCHCFLGVITLCLTNPIWVTKTRLVLQYSTDASKKQYKGMMDALVKIYRHEGIPGLYRVQKGLYGSVRVVLCSLWVNRFLLTWNNWWNSPLCHQEEHLYKEIWSVHGNICDCVSVACCGVCLFVCFI